MAYKSTTKDAGKVPEKILQTAINVFAAKGFGGARVDEIAKDAGVNKASIYYHIGDKEALYKEVLNRVFAGAAQAADDNISSGKPVEEKLKGHIRSVIKNAVSIENFAPLLMREVASGGENMPREALAQMGRVIQALKEIVDEGVKKGEFREVNLFALHIMVIGGLNFYIAGKNIRKQVAGKMDGKTASMALLPVEEMTEEVAKIALSALKKPDTTPRHITQKNSNIDMEID